MKQVGTVAALVCRAIVDCDAIFLIIRFHCFSCLTVCITGGVLRHEPSQGDYLLREITIV